MKKVLVAMSGGVDSSVCARLLQEQGFLVIGAFMRLGQNYQNSEKAARAVCRALDIQFYPINLANKFEKEVIAYFIDSYKSGLTPNPCVRCNQLIKFGELLRIKDELEADYLATGHYARIVKEMNDKNSEEYRLYRGRDVKKDQSYFLYKLKSEDLSRIFFPLGDHTKEEIKAIALKNNLPSLKTESQDVCFLMDEGKIIPHNDFLRKYIKQSVGPIMTLAGDIIGEHQGLPFYTKGQRRGIEIGGTGPYYAVKMDYINNVLYVTDNQDDSALFNVSFVIDEANWLDRALEFPLQCETFIRYRHKGVKCQVGEAENGKHRVNLTKPERAVTLGQSAVFYQGEKVLGGGVICGL